MKKKGKDLLLRYKGRVLACAGGVLLLALLLFFWQSRSAEQATLNQTAKGSKAVVVIDPGHGGIQVRPKKSGLAWAGDGGNHLRVFNAYIEKFILQAVGMGGYLDYIKNSCRRENGL